MSDSTLEAKQRKLDLLREKKLMEDELPHIYGWPWYTWAWEFYKSRSQVNFLCAANQISKSSTQIRKCIEWATNTDLWPKLWSRRPNQFWYLYPTKDVATIEFEKKWTEEFLPTGSMKTHPEYGWHAEYDKKHIKAIHFNTGVSVYFKTYAQDAKTLQTGTVYAIFCDEELPDNLYDELQFRLSASGGYFHMVFTATLGQELWWRTMEAQGTDLEMFPEASKWQVSMYDCLKYRDGSDSLWTMDKIKSIERKCKSKAEILRRVYGKFIKETGRTYYAFDPTKHYCKPFEIPREWPVYTGVDIGSGGKAGHPSSIVFIAVQPDYKKGYVFKGWRGDGEETTAGDVVGKYRKMRGTLQPVLQKYDFASADFGRIATSLGLGFTKADKAKEKGEDLVNTLLANGMIELFDTDEIRKLGVEMLSLQKSTPKTKAKDDFCDSFRYGAIDIPWDMTDLIDKNILDEEPKKEARPMTEEEWQAEQIRQRRGIFDGGSEEIGDWKAEHTQELDFWNGEYGN